MNLLITNYEREKEYAVNYKGIVLPHRFYADFIVSNKVISEVKGKAGIASEDIVMTINYLKVSGNKITLIINFGETKLNNKRIIL